MRSSQYIQKAKGEGNFVIVPNQVAQNPKLSLRARGLLLYLLSLPENWIIRKTELWKGKRHALEGRIAVVRAFEELEMQGYIRAKEVAATPERPPQVRYFVHSSPLSETEQRANDEIQPIAGNPTFGNPTFGNPTFGNRATTKETPTKKTPTKETHTKPARVDSSFEDSQMQSLFEKVSSTFPDAPASTSEGTFQEFLQQGGGAEKCLQTLEAYLSWKAAARQILHSWRGFIDKEVIKENWIDRKPPRRAQKASLKDFLDMPTSIVIPPESKPEFHPDLKELMDKLSKIKNHIPAERIKLEKMIASADYERGMSYLKSAIKDANMKWEQPTGVGSTTSAPGSLG